jgi:predicted ATP-grasp superfamily ATP-dependent carboligase
MSSDCDVLLTYAWVRSTYTALRSLNRLRLRIAVADENRVGMSQGSRFSAYKGRYPSPYLYPEKFIEAIVRILEDTGALFLLPGHEEGEVLARYRQLLPERVILPLAGYEKITLSNDKRRTVEFATQLNLPVPRYVVWKSEEELDRGMNMLEGPVVIKLHRSNSAKGVFFAEGKGQIKALCKYLIQKYDLIPERYPLLQEKIQGEGWGVSCLYWEGECLATFTHQRLREKTSTGGTSTLRVSKRNAVLEEITRNLLDGLEWHGLAMVEFKFDPKTNQGWLIEINPRLWGSIHLAVASGVDFPAWLYITATRGVNEVRKYVHEQKNGVIARWYLGDVIAAIGALQKLQVIKMFKLLLPGGADTFDDWYWDDPGATIGQAAHYLFKFIQSRSLNPVQDGMIG